MLLQMPWLGSSAKPAGIKAGATGNLARQEPAAPSTGTQSTGIVSAFVSGWKGRGNATNGRERKSFCGLTASAERGVAADRSASKFRAVVIVH